MITIFASSIAPCIPVLVGTGAQPIAWESFVPIRERQAQVIGMFTIWWCSSKAYKAHVEQDWECQKSPGIEMAKPHTNNKSTSASCIKLTELLVWAAQWVQESSRLQLASESAYQVTRDKHLAPVYTLAVSCAAYTGSSEKSWKQGRSRSLAGAEGQALGVFASLSFSWYIQSTVSVQNNWRNVDQVIALAIQVEYYSMGFCPISVYGYATYFSWALPGVCIPSLGDQKRSKPWHDMDALSYYIIHMYSIIAL